MAAESDETAVELEIFSHPGKKSKSQVWKYFGFLKAKEGPGTDRNNLDMENAICKICRKVYKNTGNTTNFMAHIKNEYALPGENVTLKPTTVRRKTQPTISFTRLGDGLSKDKQAALDDKLRRLIVGKVLPTSLVENKYFKDFVHQLEPRYKLPDRKSLMASLQNKQQEVKGKMQNEIKACENVAITHDGWTSINTESFDTTTVHYINSEWNLKSVTLDTKKIQGSHTSEKIAESLMETKKDWGLPSIIATTDNAANEKKAFNILDWDRFGCYGHRLNLVVKNALAVKEVERLLGKGRKLVTLFHTSSSASDKLKEKQKLLLSSQIEHKLIADVATRWNSTLAMLRRLVEQMPAIVAVAMDDSLSSAAITTIKNCVFNFEEATVVEKLVEILSPFENATTILCAEKTPTMNKVIPVVIKLERLLEENESDPSVIKKVKNIMRQQLELRTEMEDMAYLACVLNPYTKDFNFLPDQRDKVHSLLRENIATVTLKTVIKREKPDERERNSEPALPSLPDTSESPNKIKRIKVEKETEEKPEVPAVNIVTNMTIKSADSEDWLDDVVCLGETTVDAEDVNAAEIKRYLDYKIKTVDTNLTVLEWWKHNGDSFPKLSVLAKKYLCCQASSVSAERVFSLAGQIVNKKRSRLTPENVNLFIFLNKNMDFW